MFIVVKEPAVYHYGRFPHGLVPTQINWHFEGDTLSVSLCPSEWFTKAPNHQVDAELYKLSRADGRDAHFVDLERLSHFNRVEIDLFGQEQGLGAMAALNISALSVYHDAQIPKAQYDIAFPLAWANDRSRHADLDGIWFSARISQNMPLTSRGGIFQHKLDDFVAHSLGAVASAVFPSSRRPHVVLVPV